MSILRMPITFSNYFPVVVIMFGCSQSNSAYPLDAEVLSELEAAHEMVLCVAEHRMNKASREQLRMVQCTMNKIEFLHALNEVDNLLLREFHVDARTMAAAYNRIDLSEIESTHFPIDYNAAFGIPGETELMLEVSCPVFLRNDKTLAFLIFRQSKGTGNYLDGALTLEEQKGVWMIKEEFLMGIQ